MEGSLGVRKGAWAEEEDILLKQCIQKYGEGKWHLVPVSAGIILESRVSEIEFSFFFGKPNQVPLFMSPLSFFLVSDKICEHNFYYKINAVYCGGLCKNDKKQQLRICYIRVVAKIMIKKDPLSNLKKN